MAEPAREIYDPEAEERPSLELVHNAGGDAYKNASGQARDRGGLHVVKPDQVYDNEDERPKLRSLEGGKKPGDKTGADEQEALDNSRVKQKEKLRGNAPFTSEDEQNAKNKKGFWTRGRKIAAGASGIGLLGGGLGIFGFSLLVPLKIENVIQNVNKVFMSTTNHAEQKMVDNLFNKYIGEHILPGISNGNCKSTIEPGCVSPISGENPVHKLFRAWHERRLETTLAKDYGIVFGRDGSGKLYMAVDGVQALDDATLKDVMSGKISIFDDNLGLTFKEFNRAEFEQARQALRDAFQNESLFKRIYHRHKYGKLLEGKYGVVRCVIACVLGDKLAYTIEQKKLAAQYYFFKYVVGAVSKEYSLVLTCMLDDSASFCQKVLDDLNGQAEGAASDPALDDTKLSPMEKQIKQDLLDYAGAELENLDNLAAVIEKAKAALAKGSGGFIGVVIQDVLTKIFGEELGGTIAKFGAKAIPIVGWVLLAAQIIHIADTAGPLVRWMTYAINAAAAVHMYMLYSSLASEIKAGKQDGYIIGSFSKALETNMTGAKEDSSDMTSTPLAGWLLGFGRPSSKDYKCNDGTNVAKDQMVCPEEKLDRGNGVVDALKSIADFIPGLAGLANVINLVNDLIGKLVGGLFDLACHALPGCEWVVQGAAGLIGRFASWFINVLVPSPFTTNMSGGRSFDMIAAGADVGANKSCQVELGCAKLSNQQVAEQRNEQAAQDKAEFDRQPMFARIFSTSTPYSLVSRMAIMLPSSPVVAVQDSFASFMSNPFSPIASLFSSITSSTKAFADTPPISDPFGVVQYGYSDTQIPSDPEKYWDANCTGDYNTPWMNAQQQDPNTGEALATTPEPCHLIMSMVQSSGTVFDTSLAPPNSLNPDTGTSPSGTGVGCRTGGGKYAALVSPSNFAGVDQGIDFTPSSPAGFDICSPVSGTIVYVSTHDCIFNRTPGCTQIREKLDQSPNVPNSSQYIYYAEIIQVASGIQVGTHVNAGTVVGHNAQSPGIEVGWATGATGPWLCGIGVPTPCGISFDAWIQALSAGVH